ncbi:hypothetical protein GCM10011608_22100 [Micromonospora sonchi]|uniref:DUF397 domain-containing protein n=1 Tax=Micromonospora sonchi TaxID=1763543 RepID=A0A917TTU0_9ACTN|nr:DUF397 domain-containing protein [Micromonospora sonchi]GGM37060.1 hypothetical protein GCM10011608_22100 [Micromonospora sonchi]
MTPTISAAVAVVGWRKSSHSGDEGACVEVGVVPGTVAVRDSKDPGGPLLLFPPAAWSAFAQAPPTR